jgi:hypothetical protein
MSGVVWKLLSAAFTVGAGVLAQKVLSRGWSAATGHTPPTKPENPEVGVVEAITFAAVAGALLNVARVVATRQAAAYYAKRHGGAVPEALRDPW